MLSSFGDPANIARKLLGMAVKALCELAWASPPPCPQHLHGLLPGTTWNSFPLSSPSHPLSGGPLPGISSDLCLVNLRAPLGPSSQHRFFLKLSLPIQTSSSCPSLSHLAFWLSLHLLHFKFLCVSFLTFHWELLEVREAPQESSWAWPRVGTSKCKLMLCLLCWCVFICHNKVAQAGWLQ